MTQPPRRVHPGWIVAGGLVWLILACSISLETGQQTLAQGGGITILGLSTLLVLSVTLRAAVRSVRAGLRLLRRHGWEHR